MKNLKGKKGHAFDSGMRAGEKAPDVKQDVAPADKGSEPNKGSESEKPVADQAFSSGMRGAEKPVNSAQATAHSVEQGLQPGTALEGIAQGEDPPMIDAGDHYQIPKAHLVDGGDHYKLPKKAAPKLG